MYTMTNNSDDVLQLVIVCWILWSIKKDVKNYRAFMNTMHIPFLDW